MTIRAKFQSSYLWRYLIMAVAGIFMALWFAFDGLVTYPKKLEQAEAFEQLQQAGGSDREIALRWRELAASQGWPQEQPEKSAQSIENDIMGQFVFGGLSLLLGIPALFFYVRSRNRWIEGNDLGIKTSWGQELRYADVSELNKKRWENKGIARAYYTQGGSRCTFVFDDFKYEREPIGQMLRQLESRLRPEQIVGGISEAERDAQKQSGDEATRQTGQLDAASND